ncbi:hypothetical protein [Microvirga tunisiensis]|uniref:Uncharacterized protein n=1 Tax=Microvirga tunisiensis TaxID=2108360 RepID=A0A5N7MQQ9_9HYPH|nr:hypothetical protein [Microvirga tunisiensis]MPR11210.1 hypothetical protein [Microvirga tunisiensis]MPR29283.1 hypothetical protein [Microvirga tunisiensis]
MIRSRQDITTYQLLFLLGINQEHKNTCIVAAACLSQSISASLSPKLTRPNEQRWISTMLRMGELPMFRESASRLSNVHRGLIVALSLSAAAGWASFALSRHASVEMDRQLRNQVAGVQATQSQLLAERTKTQASLSEIPQLRRELATARSEVNRLSQARDPTLADLPPVRPDAKGANLRSNDANDDVSRTGSIGEKTNKTQQDKAVSAKPPEKQHRNQQIVAVGIAALSGQKLAEKPQSGKALTVISELDTATLRQLAKSAEAPVR